jgi:Zn-dependent protease with chaperone function
MDSYRHRWKKNNLHTKICLMKIKKKHIVLVLFLLTGCASSTDEGAVGVKRQQLFLASAEQINAESAKSYEQIKAEAAKKKTLNSNLDHTKRVQEIAKRLIPFVAVFRSDAIRWNWEANVITADDLNAWCMPGGKIMFYSGIIEKLNLTDAEIAAVMGHEIAHALREHGRERYSQAIIQQGVVAGASILAQVYGVDQRYIQGGAILGVMLNLKYGRGQESEADTIGLELMARAGYNPEEAVTLWKKMGSVAGGKGGPEFLSTHPSGDTRIKEINAHLPKVLPLYRAANKI